MTLPMLELENPRQKKIDAISDMIEGYNQKKQSQQLSKDLISIDPENRMNHILSKIIGSGIPLEQQAGLFKMLSLSDPFKQQQQERLAMDSILNRYSKRIGEIDTALKAGFGSYEERKGLEQQRKSLQAERDRLLGFESIQEEQPDLVQEKPVKAKRKAKFDLANPEHKKKRDEIIKKTKGNRKQAEQLLLREFEL